MTFGVNQDGGGVTGSYIDYFQDQSGIATTLYRNLLE